MSSRKKARWIAQGAVWPAKPLPRSPEDTWQSRWLRSWEDVTSPRYIPVWIAAIIVLLLMLVLERINLRRTMASVRNVAGMLRPEPGRIAADEWFDFRPIPEIEK